MIEVFRIETGRTIATLPGRMLARWLTRRLNRSAMRCDYDWKHRARGRFGGLTIEVKIRRV